MPEVLLMLTCVPEVKWFPSCQVDGAPLLPRHAVHHMGRYDMECGYRWLTPMRFARCCVDAAYFAKLHSLRRFSSTQNSLPPRLVEIDEQRLLTLLVQISSTCWAGIIILRYELSIWATPTWTWRVFAWLGTRARKAFRELGLEDVHRDTPIRCGC